VQGIDLTNMSEFIFEIIVSITIVGTASVINPNKFEDVMDEDFP